MNGGRNSLGRKLSVIAIHTGGHATSSARDLSMIDNVCDTLMMQYCFLCLIFFAFLAFRNFEADSVVSFGQFVALYWQKRYYSRSQNFCCVTCYTCSIFIILYEVCVAIMKFKSGQKA